MTVFFYDNSMYLLLELDDLQLLNQLFQKLNYRFELFGIHSKIFIDILKIGAILRHLIQL